SGKSGGSHSKGGRKSSQYYDIVRQLPEHEREKYTTGSLRKSDEAAKEIQSLRDKVILSRLLEKETESSQMGEGEKSAFPIQNSMEAIMLKDELKRLKNAIGSHRRDAYLLSQESKQNEEMEAKLKSQVTEKEALQLELEQLSKEINKLSNEVSKVKNKDNYKNSGSPIPELVVYEDSEGTERSDKGTTKRDWVGGGTDRSDENEGEESETSKGSEKTNGEVEESLLLDEDAVVIGVEGNTLQTGRVVLDPENENYGRYYEEEDDNNKEGTGLIPVIEKYDDMMGVEPVVLEKFVDDSYHDSEEGLMPIEGVIPKIENLQAFEEEGRSLLPPSDESQAIQFEEAYLARHPELINTDNVYHVKDEEIKRAFEGGKKKKRGDAIDKKREKGEHIFEFVDFNMNRSEIERLKRNPFKTPEEKKKILGILQAKEEFEKLKRESKSETHKQKELLSSSLEASLIDDEVSTSSGRGPPFSKKGVEIITDSSLFNGDFEEASGSESHATSENTESEQPGLTREVPISRLHAIKRSEKEIKREKVYSNHDYFKQCVKCRNNSGQLNQREKKELEKRSNSRIKEDTYIWCM
ncbi:signal peptide containing protein, partial [Cryptosporidium ryanae]|uniref:signal peptide containing protein n=1 Tax=Cryptosporidium ryanae TaxID=515981 RepID=UPI00351A99D2